MRKRKLLGVNMAEEGRVKKGKSDGFLHAPDDSCVTVLLPSLFPGHAYYSLLCETFELWALLETRADAICLRGLTAMKRPLSRATAFAR